ncbi:MAG: efflux RND transporter periplasmic adaptor subunit [Gammaproteobacteria bacterium]|nr:efflux RND transporter periplasmic adaptor subunit [Gammaproteobacteria bacterium]MBT4605357.1 efflux RND transporter periplasmic adaptor subunit [Thiotrichales bacterium]MBT3473691.1 efflux RND transporter periplasmic adaptor subunit [Gammaproteobacteria bacterium]MBT3967514.1 efflux RND transporter periplasmic adaptor subunit [Gammaproteobacteria bacterium]MBT4080873.1 efflux RND transporter periplasmic adaptor subunit [Gammaproteobacteria bacterium]
MLSKNIISTVAALAVGFYVVADEAPAGTEGNSGAPSTVLGQVITIGSARTGVSVTLGGSIVPYKMVTLNAELPGSIENIAGKEGDRFDEGEILVRIDDDTLLAKRQEVEAQRHIAEAALRNADVQLNKTIVSPNYQGDAMMGGLPSMMSMFTDPMRSSGFGDGDPDFERYSNIYSSQTQVESAQASVVQADAQLKQLDAQIRNAKSIAPFTGVIMKKMVEVGDTVQPGQPLVEFADLDRLQLQVEVPARLVAGLKEGMMMPAKLDVGGVRLEVRVAQIYPSADMKRHSVTVKFDLPKGSPAAPGMYSEIMIPDLQAHVSSFPVVPTSSLLWRGTLPAVFILGDNGEPELRVVRVGELVDNKHVTILSGLVVGEQLVVSPSATGWSSGSANQRF